MIISLIPLAALLFSSLSLMCEYIFDRKPMNSLMTKPAASCLNLPVTLSFVSLKNLRSLG